MDLSCLEKRKQRVSLVADFNYLTRLYKEGQDRHSSEMHSTRLRDKRQTAHGNILLDIKEK